MNKWVKISDYLFFQEGPGVRNNQYTSEGVKLLNVANLVNGEVDLSTSNRYISVEEAYGKYKHFLADEGDLIIASSGIKVEYFDKKMGFIKKEHLPICMNTSTIRFKSLDINKLNINYFMYYLKSQSFKSQLSKQITGSAQLNFGPSHLKKMKFPIVSLNKQLLINSILGNLDNQIRLKEKQIIEYDSLIKSRFVEMFGQDLKGKSIRLGDLAEVITKGTTPTTLGYDFVDDGVNFIKVECITETGKFIKEKMLHINEECNEKLKRSKLKKDDILFSIAGAIGRTAIVTDDILPANTNQALSIIRLRKDVGLNVEFLNQVFKTDLVAEQIEKRINGVAQMNVSLADIGNLKIIRPTIERQNEFASFVKQVDKLKFAVQKSLDETQTLFDSLMQQYFG